MRTILRNRFNKFWKLPIIPTIFISIWLFLLLFNRQRKKSCSLALECFLQTIKNSISTICVLADYIWYKALKNSFTQNERTHQNFEKTRIICKKQTSSYNDFHSCKCKFDSKPRCTYILEKSVGKVIGKLNLAVKSVQKRF